ncbi:MAG: hypothetical protein PUA61_06290 [Succinatimonas hippei]|nr:hypothetical protein [Succinatimonas hippei]
MPMPPRFQPSCPPDAHKVMRDPENKVAAALCVRVEDKELENGPREICELLGAFSKNPIISCSDNARLKIEGNAAGEEIMPAFLKILEGGGAVISQTGHPDHGVKVCDLTDESKARLFLDELLKDQVVVIPMASMYILRSISTVYAWDKLLAQQFLRQYEDALNKLTAPDRTLLEDVRYGRVDALKVKELSATAYPFLKLERKLFLQYPSED